MAEGLDLELDTLWFTKPNRVVLPPSLTRLKNMVSGTLEIRRLHQSGKRNEVITVILWTDTLSTSKIRVIWDPANPAGTAEAKQKHLPPPPFPTVEQLVAAQKRYGHQIVRWCQKRMGTRVGNGQCWTLAHRALEEVAKDCKAQGLEPVMVSRDRVHGACIYISTVPAVGSVADSLRTAGVAEGDILELKDVVIFSTTKNISTGFRHKSWIRFRFHTAIITGVDQGNLLLVEQHGSSWKRVGNGSISLDRILEGEARIYRPMEDSWCPFVLEW